MLSRSTGNFTIRFAGDEPRSLYKEGVRIGRLATCEIVLDDKTVSRIHAGINFLDEQYVLVNLSSANAITLNGRVLGPQKTDVLAGGDTIQIGPFTVDVSLEGEALRLNVQRQATTSIPDKPVEVPYTPAVSQTADVLKVFWEKRSREKEDWGTRLRPTEKPKPGKAMFNWRPTRDLRRPWRFALFVWAILIVGAVAAFAYLRYPQVYEPRALSNPHALKVDETNIAARSNGNSCTTCHTTNQPIENACIQCHTAEQFHATNTRAHETAGITCTVCHKEHRGADVSLNASAIQSCAQCHNDSNKETYNDRSVHTAHGGTYGYPVQNGVWTWKGVYREVADAIPEINSSATGDKDDQAKLSRQFHTVHVARLMVPQNSGLKGDSQGRVSCSTCHDKFGVDIDRIKPRQTCAACHTTQAGDTGRDQRFTPGAANCISCHTQHPFSGGRWSEFLSADALRRRRETIAAKTSSGGQQP
ncbi:MAG TPA: FHA domain-containing protein [Pyrinomonadaceae bacterium]|jgi:hypothetical protein|nr:FHA domain-containing protein [Pyrinomonadaceae bacterium]